MRLSLFFFATLLFCFHLNTQDVLRDTDVFMTSQDSLFHECGTDERLATLLSEDPAFRTRHEAMEEKAYQYFRSKTQPDDRFFFADFTLPVVVHIIHQSGPENVSDADVEQAIEWLNDGFANINYYDQGTGVDTRIQFCLAKRDPDGNATSGINRVEHPLAVVTNDVAMKDLSRWDPLHYINIWLVKDAGGPGGYAYLPSSHGSPQDGIVMLAEKILNVGSGHSTMIHEMGHYLGLYHTFQGGCLNDDCLVDGDRVCDTPPDGTTAPPPACTVPVNSCNTDTNSGLATDEDDSIWNYVDYGNYSCRSGYTQGQADRMVYFIENVRFSLLESDACVDPCPTPFTASFTADQTMITLGETVNFDNTSTGGINYEWQVNGVPFANSQDAAYTFDTGSGDFEITLVASNNDPNCTETFTQVIEVECPVEVNFTAVSLETIAGGTINFTNTSSGSNDFEWRIDGVPFATSTDASYTFSVLGTYRITLVATDATGVCEEEFSLFVNVVCVTASFSASSLFPEPGSTVSFSNTSQGANGYSWSVNGVVEGSGTDFSFEFPQQGIYTVCLDATAASCEDSFCQELFVFEAGVGGDCEGTFIRRIGLSGSDEDAHFLMPYPNGNFLIAGVANDRSVIIEVDPSGNIVSQRSFDFTTGGDFIRNLILDSEGYLIGATRDQIDNNTQNHIFKYDYQNDNFIWIRSLSNPAYTRIEGIFENPLSGNYTMYGMTNPDIYDNYMFEVDRNTGLPQWQRRWDFGGNTDVFHSHAADSDHLYLAAANRFGGNLGDIRATIFKFDFTGNLEWSKAYLNTLNETARSYNQHCIIENDTIISVSRANLNGTDPDGYTVQLFKTDLNGNMLWAKDYSISDGTFMGAYKVHPIIDGYILHGAYYLNSKVETFFFRITKNGDLVWAKRMGTDGNDLTRSSVLQNGFIYFAASSDGLSGSNDMEFLFGKISLDGDVVSEGCDLIEDIEVDITVLSNPAETTVSPVNVSSPNYSWNPASEITIPIDLTVQDIPSCECQDFNSAGCEETFVTAYGTNNAEEGRAIAPVPEGTLAGGARNDMVLMTLMDAGGQLVWERTFDIAPEKEQITSMIVDSDQNVVAVGFTIAVASGDRVPFAFKYDYQNNALTWVRTLEFSIVNTSSLHDVLENPINGNYFLFGQLQPSGPPGSGCDGVWIDVDRNTGNMLSVQAYQLGSCETFSAAVIQNNRIYTTGRHNFAGGGTNRMRGAITELDFNGNDLWSRMYLVDVNTNARLYTTDIVYENNTLYVTGQGDTDGTSATDISLQFFQTNMTGDIQWAREYDITGAVSERCRKLFSVPDGFLILGDYELGDRDIFLIKTDKNGVLLWSRSYGGNGEDEGFDLLFSNGQIYIIGRTTSFGNGNSDMLLLKLDLEGNIQDDNCDFEGSVNITADNFGNPYDGSHPLISYQPPVSLSSVNPVLSDADLQEEQLCFSPCIDTCANGAPLHEVPDALLQFAVGNCQAANTLVSVQVCNADSVALPVNTPVSFYLGNPTTGNASVITVTDLPQEIAPGDCELFEWEITVPAGEEIFVIVNDNGSTPAPFSLSNDFPNTAIPECDYTNNMGSFTIDYTPPVLDLGPDVSECHFGVTELDAGPGFASYNWSNAGTEQVFTAWEPGTYWVEVTDSCGGVQTDTVVIEVDPGSLVDIGMDTVYLCQGDSTTFSVTGFEEYQWYPDAFIDCDDCATVTVFPDTSIAYILIASSENGCISEDTVFVEIVTDTVIIFENEVICEGDSVLFFGNWLSDAGTYENVDQSGSCMIITSLTLQVLEGFEYTLTITDEGCLGAEDGALEVQTPATGVQFSLDGVNYQDTPVFANLPPGDYELWMTEPQVGCNYMESFTIAGGQAPLVILPPDITLELGDFYNIDAFTPLTNALYVWTPADWLSCTDCEDPLTIPEETILYTLTVSDEKDCEARDSILITVEFNPKIYAPNAFSPNGDGINDVFHLFGEGVSEVQLLQIFDRWGELIYDKANFSIGDPLYGWDGTFKGKPMDPGVFVFYAFLRMTDGSEQMIEGDITLLR